MVARQIRARGVADPRVLRAMEEVPREWFVDGVEPSLAYGDHPLGIGWGQTISQPYMVAAMAELLNLKGGETVLEIGTGSGYGAAILSRLAARVVSVERHTALLEEARFRWQRLGLDTILGVPGDGSLGYPAKAPYDAICVTAAAPSLPEALLGQLRSFHSRLVIPVGSRLRQTLQVVCRTLRNQPLVQNAFDCVFVPLIGKQGWPSAPHEPR
ncbi:MAG: protein-L-isoaspartate(D-aspartate) O-methyltransferase [Magnetococcales bacterium]|nr:protein-L-isoaspartate(D-aspartate) O-methyltransferase [Magnetococcales bacterium]